MVISYWCSFQNVGVPYVVICDCVKLLVVSMYVVVRCCFQLLCSVIVFAFKQVENTVRHDNVIKSSQRWIGSGGTHYHILNNGVQYHTKYIMCVVSY